MKMPRIWIIIMAMDCHQLNLWMRPMCVCVHACVYVHVYVCVCVCVCMCVCVCACVYTSAHTQKCKFTCSMTFHVAFLVYTIACMCELGWQDDLYIMYYST